MTQQPAQTPPGADWHRADIIAALRKRGWTLRKLSAAHGRTPGMAQRALSHSIPLYESWIAAAIGVPPSVIWPSRYEGQPNRGPGRRQRSKSIAAASAAAKPQD